MALYPCPYCPHEFDFSFAFIHHVKSQHRDIDEEDRKIFVCHATEIEPYSCNQCRFITDTKVALFQHLKLEEHDNGELKQEPKMQDDINKRQCFNCDFTTYSALIFFKHISELCPVNQRLICHVGTKTNTGLTIHQTLKHKFPKTKQLNRVKSTYHTTNKQLLINRVTTLKHSMTDDSDYLKCSKCEYKTQQKHLLKRHFKRNHNKDMIGEFTCNQCDYVTHKRYNLQVHDFRRHSGYEPNVTEIKCAECAYVVDSIYDLRKHILRKHTDVNEMDYFQCSECLKKYKLASYLRQHVKRCHITTGGIKCDQCSFSSDDLNKFKNHVKFRHGDNIQWIQCELCDYKAKNKWALKSHCVNKHTPSEAIEWFPCNQCNYKTKQKNNLLRHISGSHSVYTSSEDPKWFLCDQCNYRTKQKNTLLKHISSNHDVK